MCYNVIIIFYFLAHGRQNMNLMISDTFTKKSIGNYKKYAISSFVPGTVVTQQIWKHAQSPSYRIGRVVIIFQYIW